MTKGRYNVVLFPVIIRLTNDFFFFQVKCFSTETLLDILLVLFNECNNSSLRKEKTVTDFIEIVKPVANRVKNLRLCKDDFEILKVIGRGAFGEVRNCPVRIPFDYEIILLGKYPSQILRLSVIHRLGWVQSPNLNSKLTK